MGWNSGSELMDEVIWICKRWVPEGAREQIYEHLICKFENEDWDTQDECLGKDIVFDKVLKKMHPDWDWDWDWENNDN